MATPRREDGGHVLHIELEDLSGRQSGAEPEGDDATGARPDDEIKMIGDPGSDVALQTIKDGRHENSADTSTVDRQDRERLIAHNTPRLSTFSTTTLRPAGPADHASDCRHP